MNNKDRSDAQRDSVERFALRRSIQGGDLLPLLGQQMLERLHLDEATLLEVTEVSLCDDRITIQLTDEHRRRLIAAIKKVNANHHNTLRRLAQ